MEIGSEFSYYFNKESILEQFSDLNKLFFRSGRDAIRHISTFFKNKTVLLPSYCCHSMIEPFIDYNIIYYSIDKNFNIVFEDLKFKIEIHHPDLILIMNYFGLSNQYDFFELKEKYKFKIIEDVTHIFFNRMMYNEYSDYYVASLRKWLPIPNGGIILSFEKLDCKIGYTNNDFTSLRIQALELKAQYEFSYDLAIKNEFRSLFFKANESLESDTRIIAADPKSINFYEEYNVVPLKKKRKFNFEIIDRFFNRQYCVNDDYIPFMYPIFVDENRREEIQQQLASHGIYCPVIWPINDEQRNCSNESYLISKSILCIPIDQRYTKENMNYILDVIKRLKL